jgi:opacity protein-like surface antigen
MNRISSLLAASVLAVAAASPAAAGVYVLYDSPSSGYAVGQTFISGLTNGYPTYAYDTFDLSGTKTVTDGLFDSWTLHGATVKSVDWAIYDNTFTVIAGGTAAVTSTFYATNLAGYDIDFSRFAIPDLTLPAGTYALLLENAVSSNGRLVGWDQTGNSPSFFGGNRLSQFPNTFQIIGKDVAVPEPASWALMLIGFAGLGVALRNRPRASMARLL